MDPYRTSRLNQSIREVLAELILVAVKDPRVGFVTINAVRLNRDHSVAEVLFTVVGEEEDRRKSLQGLKKARGFLQSKLVRTLGLRQAPNLRFVYDDSLDRGLAMDTVLDEMEARGEFQDEAAKARQLCLDELEPPAGLLAGLRAARVVWLVPHHNPDPDATGSALALAAGLRAGGRTAHVLGYPDPPLGLTDLPGFADVVSDAGVEELLAEEAPDTVVLVDCHRIDRCGPLEDILGGLENRWCIDHHVVSGRRAPEEGWVEERACATATLVYRILATLGAGEDGDKAFDLDAGMATNLYAGLLNDTGGFRFDNTLPLTFELARRLAEAGADTAEIARRTLHRYRPAGVAMLQRVLASFEYHAGGRVLVARATRDMFADTGATPADTEGFVNIATAVEGVTYVGFMKEIDDQEWRVSLRVRGEGDVQELAARHGGGGHRKAAGCTLEGTADEVAARLAADLTAALTG